MIAAFVAVPILLLGLTVLILLPTGPEERSGLAASKGYVLEDGGDLESAFAWFRNEAAARPGAPKFHYEAARVAERLGDEIALESQATEAWENGYRTRESCELMIRCRLAEVEGDEFFKAGMSFFESLPDSERSPELHADIKYRGGRQDEAIEMWKSLGRETREIGVIEKACGTLAKIGRADEAWGFLSSLREDVEGLDEDGYSLLAILAAGRSATSLGEIAKLAKSTGNAGIGFRMQHALLRLILNQPDEAREVFETCSAFRRGVSAEESFQAANARLFLGYLYLAEGDQGDLGDLAEIAKVLPANAVSEGETMWYRLLGEDQKQPRDVQELQQVLRVTGGNHPAVRLLLAQTLAKQGDNEAALENYHAIDGLIQHWLPVSLGRAAVCLQQRDDLGAARILAHLHASGVRSEVSAAMVRLIALHNGLALPDDEVFKKFIPAIEEILAGEIDAGRALLLEHASTTVGARLLAQLDLMGDHSEIAMQSVEAFEGEVDDWVVLAGVAERHSHPQAAVYAYERALVARPDDPALLNNWAATKMELPGFADTSGEVLEVCTRLHQRHPQNAVIFDTLAECLILSAKLDECAELLTASSEKIAPPSLLLSLGRAYEVAGKSGKALDCLKRCRERQDALGQWNLPISRSELEQKISTLEA